MPQLTYDFLRGAVDGACMAMGSVTRLEPVGGPRRHGSASRPRRARTRRLVKLKKILSRRFRCSKGTGALGVAGVPIRIQDRRVGHRALSASDTDNRVRWQR